MRVRLKNRRFSPTWTGALLTLVVLALCVRLGAWQLERADEKRALQTQYAAGEESTVDLKGPTDMLPRYQQVRARGRYDSAHQVLLDNMPSQQGRAGYRILTPFELASGRWILVDRGWIPMGATRADVPAVEVSADVRDVVGRFDELPQPGLRLDEAAEDPVTAWPPVLSFPQHTTLERVLQRSLASGVILLDPRQPDGYERAWQARFRFGPDRHVAYAVQWFALAAAASVIFVVLSFKAKAGCE